MTKKVASVPNQKLILGSKLVECSRDNPYALINVEALQAAMCELSASGFKLWCYLSKNQANFIFALSAAECKNWGLPKTSYYAALKELEEGGYLVPQTGNGYLFVQCPSSNDDSQDSSSNFGQVGSDLELDTIISTTTENQFQSSNSGRAGSKNELECENDPPRVFDDWSSKFGPAGSKLGPWSSDSDREIIQIIHNTNSFRRDGKTDDDNENAILNISEILSKRQISSREAAFVLDKMKSTMRLEENTVVQNGTNLKWEIV